MKLSRNNRIAINLVIVSISIFAWVLLLINPGQIMTINHCSDLLVSDEKLQEDIFNVSTMVLCNNPNPGGPDVSAQVMFKLNPFSSHLMGWGLMVVAMMLPKLIMPIQAICIQGFRPYCFWCSLLFVLGYLASWMVAGVFMLAAIMGLNLLMPMSYIPLIGVLIIALIWQFSPLKQRFLNLGHDHWVISTFGWAATRDSLRFGLMHGVWCIGSGWALMLFPMLLPGGHNLAMMVVTFVMFSEHLEHPRIPCWKLNLRLKLIKIIIAQTSIRQLRKI